VVLTPEGNAVLTDVAFDEVLNALNYNREQLWTAFGLVLPSAETLPGFDQRADLAQLGGMVLAVAIGRPLLDDDYPRRMTELVASISPGAGRTEVAEASQFLSWLQRALQLPARGVFASAVDAERSLTQLFTVGTRRNGLLAVRTRVRELGSPVPMREPA